jgi:hypothetical protein
VNRVSLVGLSLIAACSLLGSSAALADTLETLNFSFTDPNAGNMMASGTLTVDLTTSQALSGNGSLNSSLFVASDGITPLGTQSITLVTASSTNINGGPYPDGSFQWQDSDGTNLLADTSFSSAAPYVDSNGLLFAVGAPTSNGHYASFNFWYQGGALDWDFLGHGGPPMQGQVYNTSSSGMFTVTPVPLPMGLPLLLSGLGVLGGLSRRQRAV